MEKYEKDARKNWDVFYKNNQDKFFKDRHYFRRSKFMNDFSHLYTAEQMVALNEKQRLNVCGRFDRTLYAKNNRVLSIDSVRDLQRDGAEIWNIQMLHEDW